ncbi:MAG: ABC transporter permease [Myxococcaceae bacterium]|nr:ABC transporter permease [Myxococcaceae bacterium]
MDGLKEIAVIWSAETRRAVRSGRVLVLLGLYSMFSALVLLIVGAIANAIREQVTARLAETGNGDEAAAALSVEMKKSLLGALTSNDTALMEALSQVPIVVLVVFKVTLFFLPAYVALMGFDQISGEVGPRSIRYITVRARRSSLLMGKFLVQASLLVGLVLVIDLGVFIYARITNPDFTFAALGLNLLKFWMAAIVFSLAYIALTAFCSSMFRSPAVSLVFNFVLLFTFWLMDVVGQGYKDSVLGFIRFLSPSYYSGDLLHPQISQFGVSGAAYAGFAMLFLGGAYAVLRARDL